MLPLPPLFRLRPLFSLSSDAEIRLAVGGPIGEDMILAMVLESGPLILLLIRPRRPPQIRQIDWPDETEKRVEALCFSPCGSWLLTAVSAGALYVLPVLSLLGAPPPPPTGRLSATDATVYPPAAHAARPTAVVWWRCGDTDYAVVGGGQGEIEFIELCHGERVGGTYVRRAITQLDLVEEPLEGQVHLLISSGKQQWRLLLEKTSSDYVVPLDALQAVPPSTDGESTSEFVKAKLNNLRQMSREKLGSLQARWAESRLFRRSVQRDETGACTGGAANTASWRSSVSSSDATSDVAERQRTPKPENVTNVLGGMLVEPQVFRLGDVLAGHCTTTGTLSVHLADLEAVPLSIHKLPPSVGRVLVTDSVIFVTDSETSRLFLISYNFSQCDTDVLHFNEDSILSVFDLNSSDGLLAMLPTAERTFPAPARLRPYLAALSQTPLRGCVLVTMRGVLICEPRSSPEASLLEVGIAASPTCSAGAHLLDRLHKLFPVNVARLYETLGDMKLDDREFTQALAYYRLTKKPHMAVVHKFAARGYSSQLLHYATILLSGVSEGLLLADRRRLSDLALLAHLEAVLRSGNESEVTAFSKFLHGNRHYSAGLALQFCLLAQQWSAVGYLLRERGQHQKLLSCLTHPQPFEEEGDEPLRQPDVYDAGLRCVVLVRPRVTARFVLRLLEVVPSLPVPLLRRLVVITDPLSPDLRPLTHCLLDQHEDRRSSSESGDVTTESIASQTPGEVQPLQPDDLVDLHLHMLLHLVHTSDLPQRAPVLPEAEDATCRAPGVTAQWPAALCAGFSHAALCRRGELLVWGENSVQCLGDPELTQEIAAPRLVEHLIAIGVAVIQAACGRAHTLALTTNGIYAWGSGRQGQLGLGRPGTCPHPRLIPSLAYGRVVRVAAGQYHSLALTDDGTVLAWGWNVFGQCGSASVNDVQSPQQVHGVAGRVVAIDAGYAHSAALTDNGKVWTFGCSAYGQLGDDSTKKRSAPEVVALPEPVVHLSCGYFCCIVVLRSGRVFRWGLDPQSVRLGAQAQKKSTAAAAAARSQMTAMNGDVTTGTGVDAQHTSVDAKSCQKTVNLLRSNDNESRPAVKVTEATPPSASKLPSSQTTETLPTAVQSGTFTPETREHLRPSEVDTSEVEGRVVTIGAGSQHAVFLTAAGKLYAQGRNLDGQLGVGGRQEAPKLQEVLLPEGLRSAAVCCGADYTLVLTEDDAVWGCGSNSYAQLAKLPAADRLDDAKLVLLKNRRLLRLPQGQNSSDKLQPAVSADCQRINPLQVAFSVTESHSCAMAGEAKFWSDAERLHAVLRLFPSCYRPSQLLAKCLQLECMYAAARVCAVSGQPAAALQHHLSALKRDTHSESELENTAAEVAVEYLSLADSSVPGALLLRKLLLHLVTFWLTAELSIPRLEQLLEEQLDKLAHPLAVLLFGGSADMQLSDSRIAELFGGLSTGFCVRLCSLVCEQIAAGRICRELLPMLGDLVMPSVSNRVRGSSPRPAQAAAAADSVMDSVICQLLRHRENCFHLSAEAVEAHLDAEDPTDPSTSKLAVFTCGHSCSISQLHADQLPRLRLGLSQLPRAVPRTAELLMAQYRELPDTGAACPDCVLEYVTRCVHEFVPAVTSQSPSGCL